MSFVTRGPPRVNLSARLVESSIQTNLRRKIMTKTIVHAAASAILLAGLALPVTAQPPIPAGNDYWQTPDNGQTLFEFPDGDVESLCKKTAQGLNLTAKLRGIPAPGSDWDTIIARLDEARFDSTGKASTRIQVKHIAFESDYMGTPCGEIRWVVSLASCPQPVTRMVIHASPKRFYANIAVSVEFKAFDNKGAFLGSLFYTRELPDPVSGSGTPWSYGGPTGFRAGMTDTDNCIDVLRQKLSTYDPKSDHYYFISDLIAAGKCKRQG